MTNRDHPYVSLVRCGFLTLALSLGACGGDDGGGSATGDGALSEELCELLSDADFEDLGGLEDAAVEASGAGVTCDYSIGDGSVLVFFFGGELADHSVYEEFIDSGDYEPVEGLGADVARFETGSMVAFTTSLRMELTAVGLDDDDEQRLFETVLSRLLEREG